MAGMMRKLGRAGVCAVALLISNSTFAQSDGFAVVERGPDWKVMQKTTLENGTNRVHRYTVLGNGMNRRDASGNWVECAPVIRGFPEAVVCTGATYQVIFKRNLNQMGSVDFETSDRERIVSHPLALAYFDPEDGRREWIARIQDCLASIAGNKVVFADAFDGPGIEASVVYTYGAGRFHQDVVFTKKPGITPADLGMGSRTRLEVVTEIVQSPVPSKMTRVLKREKNTARRGQMAEPDLTDETLVFSKEMRMPLGYAFAADPARTNRPSRVPVAKRLRSFPDGRTFLTESVEWTDVHAELDRLPGLTAGVRTGRDNGTLAQAIPSRPSGRLDARPFSRRLVETARSEAMQMAAARVPEGVVVDYTILQRSYSTWLPSGTYLIPEDATAELEVPCELQNCVFKFGRNACLYIDDWDPYATPDVVFTALDDDSVGEVIAGSTGQPSGYYGLLECTFPSLPLPGLGSLDFRYMNQAMSISVWEPDATLELQYPVYLRHCDVGFVINDLNYNLTLSVAHPYACDVQTYIETNNNTYSSPYATPDAADCDGDYDNDGMDDGWEVRNFGNTSQGPAGDYDNDGMTNLEEFQMGTDPLAASDSDADGLPDGWEWHWFHHFNHTGSEIDPNGNTLLWDYQHNLDPTAVNFTIGATNDYVSTVVVGLKLDIQAGYPAYYAVFVNSAAMTNWQPYMGNELTVPLGPSDGTQQVMVGLKSDASGAADTWQSYTLYLDRTPPHLTITNPVLVNATATVAKPYLQMRGFSDEPLVDLSYDISNDCGQADNQPTFVSHQHFDADKFDFTTNYFQACDMPLATNVNAITLRATDRAGNTTTTNINVVLDYSVAMAPTVTILWPTNGMAVSGQHLTIRGTTSDETGTIMATVVNGNGTTNTIQGQIERNGMFWVERMPLNGTNQIMLQACDAAGSHLTTTNLIIYTSALVLTIDSTPTGDDLYLGAGMVSGTVSVPNAAVTVNGVPASVNGNDWCAMNVPVHGMGTATFTAMASVAGANPASVSASLEIEKPPRIIVASYGITNMENAAYQRYGLFEELKKTYTSDLVPGSSAQNPWIHAYAGSGSMHYGNEGSVDGSWVHWTWSNADPDGSGTTTNDGGTVIATSTVNPEYLAIPHYGRTNYSMTTGNLPHYCADVSWEKKYGYSDGRAQKRSVKVKARTQEILYTGGKSTVKKLSLFQLRPQAQAYGKPGLPLDFFSDPPWIETERKDIDPTSLIVGNFGKTGSDSNLWLTLPDNEAYNVTVHARGCKHYDASVTQQKIHLSLRTVTFDGISVLKDDGSGPYPTPHWTNDETGLVVQSTPTLYASGHRAGAVVGFKPTGGGSFPVALMGIATGGYNIINFWGTNNASMGETMEISTVSDRPFITNCVDFYNPMRIDWFYGSAKTPYYKFIYAGYTTNQVYVSWKSPDTGNLFHTVVNVACSNAVGDVSETNIVNDIWDVFQSLHVMKADGTGPMKYWGPFASANKSNYQICGNTPDLLKYSDGKCGAWRNFLHDTISLHGITNVQHTISPLSMNGFVIHMYFIGQGGTPPLERIFQNHGVNSYNGVIYDPSYGTSYSGKLAWENMAVEAYVHPWKYDTLNLLETKFDPDF